MTPKEALDDIRNVMSTAPVGGYYPEERQRLDTALRWLGSSASDGEVRCIIGELKDWLDTYGSDQRLRRYSGGFLQVRSWITGCLDKLESKMRGPEPPP